MTEFQKDTIRAVELIEQLELSACRSDMFTQQTKDSVIARLLKQAGLSKKIKTVVEYQNLVGATTIKVGDLTERF